MCRLVVRVGGDRGWVVREACPLRVYVIFFFLIMDFSMSVL